MWRLNPVGTWAAPEVLATSNKGITVRDINNAGSIVGSNGDRPFLYTRSRGLEFLPALSANLSSGMALRINDAPVPTIAGYLSGSDRKHAVIWTVPE